MCRNVRSSTYNIGPQRYPHGTDRVDRGADQHSGQWRRGGEG